MSALDNQAATIKAVFQLAGAEVVQGDGYPAWKMRADSKLTAITVETYKKLFGKDPRVLGIHAGLECGLLRSILTLTWFHSVLLCEVFILPTSVCIFQPFRWFGIICWQS